jgi:hypothetical protein
MSTIVVLVLISVLVRIIHKACEVERRQSGAVARSRLMEIITVVGIPI